MLHPRRLAWILALVFCVASSTDALAAKSKKKSRPAASDTKDKTSDSKDVGKEPAKDSAGAAAPDPDDGGDDKAVQAAETSAPYLSWSTRGGATLGKGVGGRLAFAGSNHHWGDGFGYFGIEGAFLFAASRNFDFGVALRVPFWPLGVAAGVELKWRLLGGEGDVFQLAVDIGVYAPITFFGLFVSSPDLGFGVQVEPALLMSYFFDDNMEIYFGLVAAVTLLIKPGLNLQVGVPIRVGFAYTIKRYDFGVFFNADIAPGYYSTGTVRLSGGTVSLPQAGFGVGMNFVLGTQFRF